MSPLHDACYGGSLECVKMLVRQTGRVKEGAVERQRGRAGPVPCASRLLLRPPPPPPRRRRRPSQGKSQPCLLSL